MKGKISIHLIVLGILLQMPGIVFARSETDSLVMKRLFAYDRNYGYEATASDHNIYLKYSFRTIKRNPTLFFVPTMYTIARGERDYLGESYGRIIFRSPTDYDLQIQLAIGNARSYRRTMPTMLQFMTPTIYTHSLFKNHLLSPFHHDNRHYYAYSVAEVGEGTARVTFTPRLDNTQLVKGTAIVDEESGRIINTRFEGDYDMIHFNIFVDMGKQPGSNPSLPLKCETEAVFKFLGNHTRVNFSVHYNCSPFQLSAANDSIVSDYEQMERMRPDSLQPFEKEIYRRIAAQKEERNTVQKEDSLWKKHFSTVAWDVIDDYLWGSIGTENSIAGIHVSPLLNPVSFGYSKSRGITYKLWTGAHYNFSSRQSVSLEANIGYNFKQRLLYYELPLRYTLNRKRETWIELRMANGNRITNSSILDAIKDERRDIVNYDSLNLDYFKDENIRLLGNIVLNKWVTLQLGSNFHRRVAVNQETLRQLGKRSKYYSFAPLITLQLVPFKNGPVLTANYERSFKGIFKSNTQYERIETDLSYGRNLSSLRKLTLRAGAGLYTHKSSDYFVDFVNFRINHLADAWRDAWAGDFQLLNDQWYNASKYYLRFNTAYEAPLLVVSRLPLLGRYVENEQLYANVLLIEHTRPYVELGYGFTTRYVALGAFVSLLNGGFKELGIKFSFELFRKW